MKEAEIYLADRGINPKTVIDGAYTSKYSLSGLLEYYHQAKINGGEVVEFEELLFEIYEKGVNQVDCDLTAFENKIKQEIELQK